jgi:hypothetical protein
MGELYSPHEDGLVGNDDLGQMSAWYVWAAMGLPDGPGPLRLGPQWTVISRVVVTRPTGAVLTTTGSGSGPYVSDLRFNGKPSTRTWVPGSFVNTGGTLSYTLSSTPTAWGTGSQDAPPSFRDGEVGQRSYVDPPSIVVPAGTVGYAEVGVQDISGSGATVQWTAATPPGLSVYPPADPSPCHRRHAPAGPWRSAWNPTPPRPRTRSR